MKRYALIAALALLLAPTAARADWLFTPNLGVTFGGDASGNEHLTYGASLAWMGAGIIGWEADFGVTPNFFEPSKANGSVDFTGSNNVFTAMGNVLVGIPVGGQTGGGFRPYGVAGVGLLKSKVDVGTAFKADNNDFGFDLGVGAIGFFNSHVGLRGDVRYFRSLQDPVEDNEFDIAVGKFDFWRGTAGVTFRW